MDAELLTIGNEILIGQITNTNAVWMAQQLNLIGVSVIHMSSVADEREAILKAFDDASERADLVLVTGGLGPTKDDITKKTFCEYLETDLITNEDVLSDVTSFFTKRNKELTDINKKQSEVPNGCLVLRNKNGTAPGMWMEKNNTIFVSMPGVPYEMQGIMTDSVLPEIKKRFKLPFIYHKTVLTQGIGESVLSEMISDWEDALVEKEISLAYLPSPGMVRLRLSSKGFNETELKNKIESETEKVKPLIEKYIYGYEEYGKDQPKIEEIIGQLLLEKGLKLGLAESCTGGYISHLITSVAGSSDYYNGCIVPYHNEFKNNLLKVDSSVFEKHGAVSKECVIAMVKETILTFKADVAIAVSGIAGPGGGTVEKPVGTTWIAVAYGDRIIQKQFVFGDNRQRNIHMTAMTALNMLRKLILKIED
ncbi:MAG: competence/damage-inducible protein CinA-like protein [Bacteroidetes bacterium]|jgi:nicotinamide-nucleotide amidase|nr:competence/damage-inducible protein CinA-like protein [Bacteroidota bacterium]